MNLLVVLKYFLVVFNHVTSESAAEWDEKLSKCQGAEIREITIHEIHEKYFNKSLSSAKLTECYLNRIHRINPFLNAVIEVNPDALEIAKKLDEQFKATGELIGPLHGIPIMVKDIFDTNDKMNTTAGSFALLNSKPKDDAQVIKLLRKAGAIIIGKTNLSEFSGFQSAYAPLGWSNRGGETKNPYNSSASPHGSSSGSAVAVAANLASVALGSETDGSIIGPASFCLVVGLKPSVGSVSRKGVIPLAPSYDSIGAITRSVADNLVVTYTIAKTPLRNLLKTIYFFKKKTPSIFPSSKRNFKVGVVRNPYFEDSCLPKDQILALNKLIHNFPSFGLHAKNISMDFSALDPEKAEINPYDQLLLEIAQNTTGIKTLDYHNNYVKNKRLASQVIITAMAKSKVDAFLIPSYVDINGIKPSSFTGFPIITVPVGIGKNGIPFGMSVYSVKESEPELIQIAYKISQIYHREMPKFL